MRIVMADDEVLALDRLRTLLAEIEDVEIVGEAQDGDGALALVNEHRPDIVILDIQMPGRNGLSTAATIAVDPQPEVIFITAHEHFAPDAFDLEAADYVLKPVRFERLRQAIDRARRRRQMREDALRAGRLEAEIGDFREKQSAAASQPGLWVPVRDGQIRVPIDTIDWIEAARDYVLLHTSVRSHMLRTTMAALEERLADTPLIRVHRSAFVRPDRVSEVRRANRTAVLVMADGVTVQVGPSYVETVEAALGL